MFLDLDLNENASLKRLRVRIKLYAQSESLVAVLTPSKPGISYLPRRRQITAPKTIHFDCITSNVQERGPVGTYVPGIQNELPSHQAGKIPSFVADLVKRVFS